MACIGRSPPSTAAPARCGADICATGGGPSADIIRNAVRRVHYVRRSAAAAAGSPRAAAWAWTRARWESGHMAHGAVWLRVRILSVLLRRWHTCRGLADWGTGSNWLIDRPEDWNTYFSSLSGVTHSHSTHSHSTHSTHSPDAATAAGSGQGPVH